MRDGDTAWHPETGQAVLDFGVKELAERAADVHTAVVEEAKASELDDEEMFARASGEFARALDLEDHDPSEARAAYQRALELDPGLVDAYVNLGRLAHEAGEAKASTRLYEQALVRSSLDPVIHFNLALALEDSQGPQEAARHYELAIAIDPNFSDAHFNLANLYEALGRPQDALRHYSAYKRLTEV